MSKWPYDKFFDQPREGLLRQERTEYRLVKNKIVRETITRRYMGADDYQDSTHTEIVYVIPKD